ncbi:MAG: GlsB/YeaQ/YmgE family stress response membrane protein [Betaproteobacteria bacterium]|nr:GlsB/YeaQ/YmgE family stress response membrane protein [Betaproteobacteria bacterium]
MNIAIWMAAGGIIGWMSFSFLRFNIARGLVISIIIGIAGGLLGGDVLSPLLASTVNPGDFNPISLFMAFASAAGCLIISNMIYHRFGV